MRRFLGIIISLIVVFAIVAGALDNGAQPVAEAMVKRFVDTCSRADGAAYGENYWRDAELVDPSGAVVESGGFVRSGHIRVV